MFTCWRRLNLECGGGCFLLLSMVAAGVFWWRHESVETLSSGGGLTSRLRRVFTWWRRLSLEYINVDVNMDHLTFNLGKLLLKLVFSV